MKQRTLGLFSEHPTHNRDKTRKKLKDSCILLNKPMDLQIRD